MKPAQRQRKNRVDARGGTHTVGLQSADSNKGSKATGTRQGQSCGSRLLDAESCCMPMHVDPLMPPIAHQDLEGRVVSCSRAGVSRGRDGVGNANQQVPL
jgi:hypothetical protein